MEQWFLFITQHTVSLSEDFPHQFILFHYSTSPLDLALSVDFTAILSLYIKPDTDQTIITKFLGSHIPSLAPRSIHIVVIYSLMSPGCSSSSRLCPLSPAALDSGLFVGWERKGPLWQLPAQIERLGALTFPFWAKKGSLGTELCHLGKGLCR